MPARGSPGPSSAVASAQAAWDALWRTPDGAPQGLEREYAPAHQRRCAPAEGLQSVMPKLEGDTGDRGRSAFAWRAAEADGEMLMPMTEAEADAYDRSEATAGNTLTYLTACGLSVAGSAQSALTFAGSGDLGAHSALGSGRLLRLGSDGRAGGRDALRPGGAKRRGEPDVEARACGGLPGGDVPRQRAASECAGLQGPAGAHDSAARSMHGPMRFGAPWVPALPMGVPAGAGASEAATGLCMGTPADEALLAGLFGYAGGYGAGFAAAQAQPLAAPARSAPGGLARALLASGGPMNPGFAPLWPAAAPAPLELARGMPGSLPALGACGPWAGLGLGPGSGPGSGHPAGFHGDPPLGFAGAGAPEGARRGLQGGRPGPGGPPCSPGASGPVLATPELRQSELQLSLGMGLGLQLDLGAWHYGPGEGTGHRGAPPQGGACGGGGAPAAGLWGAMLEGARPAGAGVFAGAPLGFSGGLLKRERSHASEQVRAPLRTTWHQEVCPVCLRRVVALSTGRLLNALW